MAAYEEGLKLENSPALQKGLREVQEAHGAYMANLSLISC